MRIHQLKFDGTKTLGLGEVKLASRSFQISFHLNPGEQEIWTEDIVWAQYLLHQADKVDIQIDRDRMDR